MDFFLRQKWAFLTDFLKKTENFSILTVSLGIHMKSFP